MAKEAKAVEVAEVVVEKTKKKRGAPRYIHAPLGPDTHLVLDTMFADPDPKSGGLLRYLVVASVRSARTAKRMVKEEIEAAEGRGESVTC